MYEHIDRQTGPLHVGSQYIARAVSRVRAAQGRFRYYPVPIHSASTQHHCQHLAISSSAILAPVRTPPLCLPGSALLLQRLIGYQPPPPQAREAHLNPIENARQLEAE